MGVAAAIPAIIGAGATVGSSLIGRKTAKDLQQTARTPTTQERAAFGGATGTAQELSGMGNLLYGRGTMGMDRPRTYYETLMGRGGRAAMQSAVAPTAESIAQSYKGLTRGLEGGYVRGGVRDLALAEAEREKTGAISRLTAGVQPAAAAALESIARYETSAGLGVKGQAGSIYSSLAGPSVAGRQLGFQGALAGERSATQTGENIGALLFSILQAGQGKGGQKKTATVPTSGRTFNPTAVTPTSYAMGGG